MVASQVFNAPSTRGLGSTAFFSYSRSDAMLVDDLGDKLRDAGYNKPGCSPSLLGGDELHIDHVARKTPQIHGKPDDGFRRQPGAERGEEP